MKKMKHRFEFLMLLALLGLFASPRPLMAAVFHVDSSAGNDLNSGTSSNAAWQTLSKVNGTTFQPGDSILFKAGSMWKGQLNPKGSGSDGSPIIIDRYGNGPTPIIDGQSTTGLGTVYFFNQEYWEINNLEIINDAETAGDRRGVYLSASNFVGNVVDHLYVRNCFIHNIKGIAAQKGYEGKRTGGIILEVIDDTSSPTRFNDIRIENCVISTVDNQGIALSNRISVEDYPGTPEWEARKFSHVLIRGNRINDVAKNAMIIRLTDETSLIEHNVCWDTAYRAYTGNTIFSRSCRGTVFQFNEGYLNRAGERDPSKGTYDGSLYDADLQSPGCIFQYSYSHDNAQGLFWGCTVQEDEGIVVRYNISENDKGSIFCIQYPVNGLDIYNNTIYIGAHRSPEIIKERSKSNMPGSRTYSFRNNLVYSLSNTAKFEFNYTEEMGFNHTLENNLFYGVNVPKESGSHLIEDPMLCLPGSGITAIDFKNPERLNGYHLSPGSPAINRGEVIPDNGNRDFWGNELADGKPDIGAHEFMSSRTNSVSRK